MKKVLMLILALVLVAALLPVMAEEDERHGYQVRPIDLERIQSDNTLVLELYGVNIIQGDPRNIPAGWQFTQMDKQLTVKSVVEHSSDEYELIAEEDTFESIVFKRLIPDMNIWGIWLNDCQSVGLSEVREFPLPLDDQFVFIWKAPDEEDDVTYTAEEFLAFLQGEEGKLFNQYNSEITLVNDKLVEFRHSDYPPGLDLE